MTPPLRAPFPYFGGKRAVADLVWSRLGRPKQYIEPFCGSAAMLLAAPVPASLEVIGDVNFYIANFWRAIKYQPQAVAEWADYPVSHIDQSARHVWLTQPARTKALRDALQADPEWPGDAQIAGWWVWGQCSWIASGWCEKERTGSGEGKIPHTCDPGLGYQSGKSPTGSVFGELSARLERVRVIHGDWSRCLNSQYGGDDTAIFFDPPYLGYEQLYSDNGAARVAESVAGWCRENGHLRIGLCGHDGDYEMPGWSCIAWSRPRNTFGGSTKTKDAERIWFSPACIKPQPGLFDALEGAS